MCKASKANSPLHCSFEQSKGVFVKAKANAEVVRVDSRLAVFVLRAKKELTVGEEICWSYGFNPVTDEDYEGTYFEEVENGVTAYERWGKTCCLVKCC